MKRLKNKVAIITGAGSGTGMGAVTARLFAQEGASVVITEGLALAMQSQNKKMRVKVLAPGATTTELVDQASANGGINGNIVFSPDAFISAEQLADYAYLLYQSDKVVGIVNEQNGFDLKDPIYPQIIFGS